METFELKLVLMLLLSVSMTALQFTEQLMFWKDGPLELIEDVELNVEVIEESDYYWNDLQ